MRKIDHGCFDLVVQGSECWTRGGGGGEADIKIGDNEDKEEKKEEE